MKIFGIIGSPIKHSLSPIMHSAAYRKLGLDCSYKAYDVTAETLEAFIREGAGRFGGLNVTVPHKVAVIGCLDELDESARLINAVNTIKYAENKTIGYNTDGVGCAKALQEADVTVKGQTVMLLGAGGAARAIAYRLVAEDADVVIANRTHEKAESLAGEIKEKTGKRVDVVDYATEALKKTLSDVDILINTTTVGMAPRKGESPLPADVLNSRLIVMDIVYNPLETMLLRDAKRKGCKTVDGVGMLVHQGAESLRIWLNIEAPIEEMREAVLKELKKN
jgi:shikimate dehydrogenase